ncbi:MAG: hypothetical protein H6708_21740 [Kofleriaceae bacterium]|nr:hypothetical protein [Myxococcales bacterium]MCB9563037.1 hypothetical protein [Kofleriaceae bacterium]
MVVAIAAIAACSNLAVGKVVPGAAPRFREGRQFATQSLGGGWYRMGALGAAPEEVGVGRLGAIVGGRLGLGTMRLGDRPALHGGGFDLRLEAMVEVTNFLGVGASVGWGLATASTDTTEISTSGVPIAAIATVTPLRPFILRAAAVAEPGTASVDGTKTSQTRLGYEAGAGIAVLFRRWHFVVLVDWRHLGAGDVATPAGAETLRSDLYLFDVWAAL